MPVSVTYQAISGNIHQGPGFLFWNILRPLFGLRPLIGPGNPPTISDPATPAAWVTAHIYPVGTLIVDSNNNIQVVTAITGTGTSGATQPTWSTVVGVTTIDNPGTNQITWQNCGPSFVWAASTNVIFDQQVRDTNGNIQQCIFAGTTSATTPTWSMLYGGVTQDGGAIWMNLGPTLAMGSNEGALNWKMTAKMEPIQDDQHTAPIDFITTGEDGEIDGTLLELNLTNVSRVMPNTTYSSGTDPNLPAGAQNYQELTFGGQLRVPRPCLFLCSYRRQFGNSMSLTTNPFKWFGAALYAAGPSSDGSFGFSLKKPTGYKVTGKGSVVTWRPVGDQIGKFFEQI